VRDSLLSRTRQRPARNILANVSGFGTRQKRGAMWTRSFRPPPPLVFADTRSGKPRNSGSTTREVSRIRYSGRAIPTSIGPAAEPGCARGHTSAGLVWTDMDFDGGIATRANVKAWRAQAVLMPKTATVRAKFCIIARMVRHLRLYLQIGGRLRTGYLLFPQLVRHTVDANPS